VIKVGRYRVDFGPVTWFQTKVPTRVWHFWWFWLIKEAKPTDIDKKQQFPLGTEMEHDGRKYHYYKAERSIGKESGIWSSR